METTRPNSHDTLVNQLDSAPSALKRKRLEELYEISDADSATLSTSPQRKRARPSEDPSLAPSDTENPYIIIVWFHFNTVHYQTSRCARI